MNIAGFYLFWLCLVNTAKETIDLEFMTSFTFCS